MSKEQSSGFQAGIILCGFIIALTFALITEQDKLALGILAVMLVAGAITVFSRRKKKGKMGE